MKDSEEIVADSSSYQQTDKTETKGQGDFFRSVSQKWA